MSTETTVDFAKRHTLILVCFVASVLIAPPLERSEITLLKNGFCYSARSLTKNDAPKSAIMTTT